MYTKEEAIEAIAKGEKFTDRKFNKVRDDLDVALAFVKSRCIFIQSYWWKIQPRTKPVKELLAGYPKQLAYEKSEPGDLITALRDAIKIRDLEASFQRSLTQKSTPKRTIKI